jgi:hypothetical protein
MSERAALRRRAVSVEALRAAAQERVAETSLRHVAREIGMSAPGLALFLGGASPRSVTMDKMRTWHLSTAGAVGTTLETARTALHLLTSTLPPGRDRVTMARRTLTIVAQLHRRRGRPPPAWVAPLWEEYGLEEAPP